MIDWNNELSDEKLAAFLDGNVRQEERRFIEEALGEEESLREVVEVVQDSVAFDHEIEALKGDYGFWELGIDPVFDPSELLSEKMEMEELWTAMSVGNEGVTDSYDCLSEGDRETVPDEDSVSQSFLSEGDQTAMDVDNNDLLDF